MYNEFYGFSEKPFELTPNPRFLYLTPSHREALDSMIDEIKNRRGFISITGEVGTGKTTLIHSLLNSLDEKVKTVYIFHPTITFKELLETILLELELKVVERSKTALLFRLVRCLTQMDADETIAIIIDEAQSLPEEVMEEIQIFSNLEPKAIQIVLVGQPEFEDKLNSQGLRQLKQRIGSNHQIGALSEEESKNYIDHRLRLVGSRSSEMFTPKALSMVCSYAHGIPRIINVLCDNAFLIGYSLSQKKIDVDIIRDVIKNMEPPFSQKTFLTPIVTAAKEFHLPFLRLNFFLSRPFLIVLSFLCLGGFVFLINRYFEIRPAKTWDIKSLRSPYADTKPSSASLPPQKLAERVSGSSAHQGSDELKQVSPEFPKPASPPNAPLALLSEEDKSTKIVTVKRGYTISSLAEVYYGMVNQTLMDFILDLNPEITDVHVILVDQKIKIPKITAELLATKSTDNTYKIRVGTFETPNFIRFYANEPALKGREVKIFPRKVSAQETWYRVVVGPFRDKDECLRLIDQLKEKRLLPAFGGILKMK